MSLYCWEEVKVLLKLFQMSLCNEKKSRFYSNSSTCHYVYDKKLRSYSNSSICHYVVWEEVKVLLKFFHMSLCSMRRSQGFTQTLPYVIMLYEKKLKFYSNSSICPYVAWEEVKVLHKLFHISLCSMRSKSRFYSNSSTCHYVVWEEVKVLLKLFQMSLCSMRRSQDFTQILPYCVIMLYEKKSRVYSNYSICHYVVW